MRRRCMSISPTKRGPSAAGQRASADGVAIDAAVRAGVVLADVARRSRAEAVHPGYGFLSENPAFAEACAAAGLVFVGPPASAMRSMGSKVLAKTLMQRAGVAIPPGYHGDATDLATLTAAAEHIGFPLLIKASCGGGGRGMRLVREAGELEAAIAGAAREALASFGDGRLLIEKYLIRSRHVEVQIFADAQGNCISFPERDCSMQRRRQKVLEETPAPRLSSSLRQVMHEAAIKAAKAVGYVGAGTVEFLVQDGRYFFLEMNTRLQVEHPITEMISGQDLVEWQLHVASGEALPLAQQDLVTRGCAMEVRICAEDPANDFLPSVGEIEHLRLPSETGFVRVDTGVRIGDRIEQYYDPLLAKVIAWGADRDEAVRRLKSALGGFEIVGVMTKACARCAKSPASCARNMTPDSWRAMLEDSRERPPYPKTRKYCFSLQGARNGFRRCRSRRKRALWIARIPGRRGPRSTGGVSTR